jgi:hypothetical protein
VVPSHEIFQRPFKVDLQFEDATVPVNYRYFPGGDKFGKTIKVWKVQTKKFPEVDPGLVSDPYGFADSPDAEAISSGLNSKAAESVALGRHGNFFLWGFSASPQDMTPEARKCFVNAICYIKKFDGQRPLVRRQHQARSWALMYAGMVGEFKPDDSYFSRLFPREVRERFGNDAQKRLSYYKENLEYLIPADLGFAVDEDVKGLGLSNRNLELLERAISMLEKRETPDLAKRILTRYTAENFADAGQWRMWLEKNQDRIFFTDVGGFKFLVAPESLAKSPGQGEPMPCGPGL